MFVTFVLPSPPARSDRRHLAAFAVLLMAPLLAPAQGGDREGEVQQPPRNYWDIPPAPALSVDEALETFALVPGFRIEVAAAEPLVVDPVAMQIGPDGRMWVVEMRGYMPNVEGEGEDAPVGTIAMLTDTDGDGRMDERTDFATGLVIPRALALVGDGLLVGEPPHLWHYRDTDGDGRADERTEVSGHYGNTQNPEHTANGLLWGLDNWIYNANHHERLRYRADGTWEAAPAPDRGQWGITQDDHGRFFYNTNSNPLRADLFPGEYLLRNPDLHRPSAINYEVAPREGTVLFPSRITPGINRGYRLLGPDGILREVTSACGPLIYRGDLYPDSFYGDAFVCEPAAHLIKRLRLQPTADGGLVGVNRYENVDFLTSTDERFRPVNLHHGPDGAMYVVDMYRGILQHRIYVTTYLRNQILERGLETPIGLGRIYRIVPDDAPVPPTRPALHTADTATLLDALSRRDAWWRETAQRLLVEQADPTVAPRLRELAFAPTNPGRLNAYWTLHGIDRLQPTDVLAALRNPDPGLRLAGLRSAGPWLEAADHRVVEHVLAAAEDADSTVRRETAAVIGRLPYETALPVLARLARTSGRIEAMSDAILSGLARRELRLLEHLARAETLDEADALVRAAAAAVINRSERDEVAALFRLLEGDPIDARFTAALIAGVEAHTYGGRDTRTRLALPVEPDTLHDLADRAAPELAGRALALAAMIDGPSALAQRAPAVELTADEQVRFELGQSLYAVCAGCHQNHGRGMDGLAPSLVGSKWVTAKPEVVAAIVLKGKEGPDLAMPPLEALDDETLAAILTYIRRSWGHQASAVSPDQVAAARTRHATRSAAWTNQDLERLVAAE